MGVYELGMTSGNDRYLSSSFENNLTIRANRAIADTRNYSSILLFEDVTASKIWWKVHLTRAP